VIGGENEHERREMSSNAQHETAAHRLDAAKDLSDFNALRFCVAPMMDWTD
jgi:hypothetical protein